MKGRKAVFEMEREILFRGKRVIDGKWVESRCPLGEMHSGTVTYDFVSKTVCQYTGLNDGTKWEELSEGEKEKFLSERNHREDRLNTKEDWNGRKIFEWDIVKKELMQGPAVGQVVWFDVGFCGFYFKIGNSYYPIGKEEHSGIDDCDKVIGNIFDAPHLLKE